MSTILFLLLMALIVLGTALGRKKSGYKMTKTRWALTVVATVVLVSVITFSILK